jgi:hypothetical protein
MLLTLPLCLYDISMSYLHLCVEIRRDIMRIRRIRGRRGRGEEE